MKSKSKVSQEKGYQSLLFVLDHKDAYRQIRNYLAGRLVGATRDEALLEEVIKCLFCKLYIRRKNPLNTVRDGLNIYKEYKEALREIAPILPAFFTEKQDLLLDPDSLIYIDQMLESAEIDNPVRDPFGDVYEVFVGAHIRGQEGQFFTPQNAVELLVSLIDPSPGETIIDPACGAGGFLSVAARHLKAAGASENEIQQSIFGVDKDSYLVSLASARLSLSTLSKSNVFCADSLAWEAEQNEEFSLKDKMGKFDIVLSNPPFGSRIVAASSEVQRRFELGYKWRYDSRSQGFKKFSELLSSVPPQVLFIERCLCLVRGGGRIALVVPESLISSQNYRYVVDYIRQHAEILAVMGMPESLFKISGKGGTHTKTCLLILKKKSSVETSSDEKKIFMAEAKWCGHDSRGRQIEKDELPTIVVNYRNYEQGKLVKPSHLGYQVSVDSITDNILAPRYYNPDVSAELLLLEDSHDLIMLGDWINSGLIEVSSGDEVGKLAYGTGSIPFVRTSDISNWEIKVDPKHCVSEEIYQCLSKKQDVQEGDILMVRDGTYLIGTCAFITNYDTRIVYQSHLYKLRVKDTAKLSPYLLLAALSSAPVQRQIKAKRFTQDIIDSLGNRISELVLPIPKNQTVKQSVTEMVKQAIHQRIEARELARKACLELVIMPPLLNGQV